MKATIRRPDGTVIELDGATAEDVAKLSPAPFPFAVPSSILPSPITPFPTIPWAPGVICGPGVAINDATATACAVPPAIVQPTAGYPR